MDINIPFNPAIPLFGYLIEIKAHLSIRIYA